MDGQITLEQFLDEKLQHLKKYYPIPRLSPKVRADEGWFDDWHYADIEQPTENDVYYTITLHHGSNYNYTYRAYANGKWFTWNAWNKEWEQVTELHSTLLAWVRIPSKYRQTDKSLHERLGMRGVI